MWREHNCTPITTRDALNFEASHDPYFRILQAIENSSVQRGPLNAINKDESIIMIKKKTTFGGLNG